MKIYIAGGIYGSYRTGSALKCIIDAAKHSIYVNDFHGSIKKEHIKGFFCKIFTAISSILNFFTCDVIYLTIMSHDLSIIKWAKIFHKPIITEFYLSFYDTNVRDRKNINEGSEKAELLKKQDIYALENSSEIILLAEADKQYYSDLLGVNFDKINYSIIPLVSNKKKEAKINYFHQKKSYMQLCWTGTYIPLQGLEKVISAMKILKEKSEIPIKLFIWGRDSKAAQKYIDMIAELGVSDCVTVHNEWGNLDKWENFIAENCDVSLGIFGDTDKAKYVMANKVVDGIAFKTPVITAYSTGVYDFCNGKDDIFIVDNTPECIAEKIMEISKMTFEDIEPRIDNAYRIYEENFSPQAFSRKFLCLLDEVEENYIKKRKVK